MKRWLTAGLLALAALLLCGCRFSMPSERGSMIPDLSQLERPVFASSVEAPQEAGGGEAGLRVDLWLSGSQLMGGLNTSPADISQAKVRYQSGGFHYRFEGTTGLYEELLTCMLSAAEEEQGLLRMLRFGNERLTDVFLQEEGLAGRTEEETRSVRRDMLTVAYSPIPSVFKGFSPQDSAQSFYHLGSDWMNRVSRLEKRYMENPALKETMVQAMNRFSNGVANGEEGYTAVGTDEDYPLLYALENIDLNRVSVIVFDPAEIRTMKVASTEGEMAGLLKQAVDERGLFDRGLSVEVRAFQLDYLGKISTFGAADLAVPLVWGKLNFVQKTNKTTAAQPMPRMLLCLIIGPEKALSAYSKALDGQIASSEKLKEQRGSDELPLTYAYGGKTVKQGAFGFENRTLTVARPSIQTATRFSEGTEVTVTDGTVQEENGLVTLVLPAGEDGVQPDRTLTLTLPVSLSGESVAADLTQLSGVGAVQEDAFCLTEVLPNRPQTKLQENAQTILLRDRIYVFEQTGQQSEETPFALKGVKATDKGLQLTFTVSGKELKSGYYRYMIRADYGSGHLEWETPAWVNSWSASVSSVDEATWEEFTRVLAKNNEGKITPPTRFAHAWGEAGGKQYAGTTVPDVPPVFHALWLSEIVAQLQEAADVETVPLIRYEFEVYVDGDEDLLKQ